MNSPEIWPYLEVFVRSYAAWVNPQIVFWVGLVISAFAAIVLLCGIYRMYQLVKPSLGEHARMHILKALFYTFLDEFVIHRNLGRCKPEWGRWILHQLVLWGMVILAACTGVDALMVHEAIERCHEFYVESHLYLLNIPQWTAAILAEHPDLGPSFFACGHVTHGFVESPLKVFYNVGAALLVVGAVGLLVRRRTNKYAYSCAIGYDWYLLILLTIVAVSGIMAEALRLGAQAAYEVGNYGLALGVIYAGFVFYVIHIIAVLVLFVTIPFTKSAHVVYRFIALLLVNYRGVKKIEVVI